jgi:RHS repeat-associated protein
LLAARSLPSPRRCYRKRLRLRRTASGRSLPYNIRFPGQYYQAETGLNQNWNRDYDPLGGGRYIESDPIGLSSGVNTYAYAEDDPTMVTDRLGLDTAMCTRKLNGFPFSAGPLYHQYVCVGNSKTGYSCMGLGPSGNNPFNTPGKIESDSYKPSACSTIQPDNKCVEDCIKKKFAAPPPNYSVDLSQGENCQTYSTGIVSECFAQCHAKSSSPAGGSK